MRWSRELQVLLVLHAFSVFGVLRHLHVSGEDLSSSYVGCRVLAAGQASHLYSHDPSDFPKVGDPLWDHIAVESGFTPLFRLHPYVQTPLWAYSLQPLCTHTRYRAFCDIFLIVLMLCTAGTLWLVARHWAPSLFHPGWIALVCAGLYVSQPFKYAIFLNQTHIIFIFVTVWAVVLARRGNPVAAGILLALAAAVKITPGYLVVYWLVSRKYKAALSFIFTSILLLGVTLATAGPALTVAYFRELGWVSNVLLLAYNNQSFAAVWMAHRYPPQLLSWHIYPLPPAIKVASLVLSLGAAVAGGLLDRDAESKRPGAPPFGAVLALLAGTMFTPIAWTHYYIVLVIPVMLLLDAQRTSQSARWLLFTLPIFVLNLYPIAVGAVHAYVRSISLTRSQFLSGLLSLGALIALHRHWRSNLHAGMLSSPSMKAAP